MPTEHTLTRRIRAELARRQLCGEALWGRKLHGSQYQRDLPDWLFCYGGLFLVIETKGAGSSHGVTPGQQQTLRAIAQAGGRATVRTTIEGVREALDTVRLDAHRLGLVNEDGTPKKK